MKSELIRSSSPERGAALVFFAFFILFLMGAAALAVDLGMLYVARSEAQRSADAAALAGASVFTGSCTLTASCESAASQSLAAQDAIAAAKANHVAGMPGTVDCDLSTGYSSSSCAGIQFSDPTGAGQEPQITVTVQRNNISLIFARMFGARTGDVSAVATAEAYMGGALQKHVTPFLVPNCDPNVADVTPTVKASDFCASVDPTTGLTTKYAPFIDDNGKILNPNLYSPGNSGALGEPWVLHYTYTFQGQSQPAGSVSPSQWSMVSFPDANGNFNNGTSDLVTEIESGPPPGVSFGCGTELQTNPGNSPVPIDKAVNTLIGASADGPTNHGQDFLTDTANAPTAPYPTGFYNPSGGSDPSGLFFSVTAGSNSGSPGSVFPGTMGSTPSIVLAPLFDGSSLSPGCSPTTNCTVTISGYAVLFIDYAMFQSGQETVVANVINLLPCGSVGNGNTGVSADASPIPIRLIQHPDVSP